MKSELSELSSPSKSHRASDRALPNVNLINMNMVPPLNNGKERIQKRNTDNIFLEGPVNGIYRKSNKLPHIDHKLYSTN